MKSTPFMIPTLAADALRYRWIRENDAWFKEQGMSNSEIDSAVDKAMKKEFKYKVNLLLDKFETFHNEGSVWITTMGARKIIEDMLK